MEHLDLLHGARRLWKLRFESCRLVDLENQVLGVERQGDLPGALIPYVYFEYLRTREAARLLPVFHHNAIDILTLACLTGIVPYAFKDPADAPLRHGAEMAGIARWLREAGETEQALTLFRRAIDAGLPTIFCSAPCGTSEGWSASWASTRWAPGSIWRPPRIRSASGRSKNSPSTTSIARRTIRERSR